MSHHMTIVHLPLGDLPGVIRESSRTVLAAHRYRIHDPNGEPLTDRQVENLLRELGNNSAQALMSVDRNPENR